MKLKAFTIGIIAGLIFSIAAVAQTNYAFSSSELGSTKINATMAQTVPPAPQPLTDIYGAGAAYATGSTPGSVPVAMNAFEAHLIPGGQTRTYTYTTLFLVPQKVINNVTNPDGTTTATTTTTFSKDLGVGAAVKALDIGPGVYATATGGPSWTGSDTSWQFNYGGTVPIRIKKSHYYIFPIATGVTTSQGTKFVFMVDFAWGK